MVAEQPDGAWGNTEYGYDFIPSGKTKKVALRALTSDEFNSMANLFLPAPMDLIKGYIGRLALRKKIGNATENTAPMLFHDLAIDLCDFSELAILLAFREIRREPGDWFPLGNIIHRVKQWQELVDNLSQLSHGQKKSITHQTPEKPKEEPWKEPTAEDKAKVSELVAQALRNLNGGGLATHGAPSINSTPDGQNLAAGVDLKSGVRMPPTAFCETNPMNVHN